MKPRINYSALMAKWNAEFERFKSIPEGTKLYGAGQTFRLVHVWGVGDDPAKKRLELTYKVGRKWLPTQVRPGNMLIAELRE